MVDDVSGKATIQLYVKYNTTTLYRSNCEYDQSLKSFVTISIIFPSLLNILLIESHILIPLFFVIMHGTKTFEVTFEDMMKLCFHGGGVVRKVPSASTSSALAKSFRW